MKNFFGEFKKFIARGNVLDMSVGIIVGSSFTAIVNGLSNFVLKPLINYLIALCFGTDSLKEIYTILKPAYVLDESGAPTAEIDLANSIYIDWGSFISAVITFIIIAFVLFSLVKIFNKLREEHIEFNDKMAKLRLSKEQKKELRAAGIKRRNKAAVKEYFAEKERKAKEEADRLAALEAERAASERAANPTTEELLKAILEEIRNK